LIPRHPRRIDTGRIHSELARLGYETTLRSIQRDLNKLSAALPISSDQSKPQGWWWQHDADLLEIPGLDPQAALVFKMAEQHLQKILPTSTLAMLQPWFRAANGTLEAQANGVGHWANKVRTIPSGPPLLPPQVAPDVQAAIYQGLLEERQVHLSYKARGSAEARAHEINPLAIVQRGNLLYVICTLGKYTNPIQLLMHRIESATVLMNRAAIVPPGFDVDDYIATGELGYRIGQPFQLVAEFDADLAQVFHETPLSRDQVLHTTRNGMVQITATVSDTMELRGWLRGFGKKVTVLSPTHLLDD